MTKAYVSSLLSAVKTLLYVVRSKAKDDGPPVRAGRGRRSQQQPVNEPAHLCRRKHSVVFDGGAARKRQGYALVNRGASQRALLRVNRIQKLCQQASRFARRQVCRNGAHGNSSTRKAHQAEAVRLKLFTHRIEGSGLRWRQVEGLRHEQVL